VAGALLVFVVVQVALAGSSGSGPQATTSAGVKKQIKNLKQRVAALEAKPDQVGVAPTTLPPSGPAGGDLTGSYPDPSIANNAVGPADVENATRSVNLPLRSFVDDAGGPDFTSGPDGSVDFRFLGNAVVIEADDDPGDEDARVLYSTVTVPQDAAPGGFGSFAFRTSKDANTLDDPESLQCFITVNGVPFQEEDCSSAEISSVTNTVHVLGSSVPFFPGDSVSLGVLVVANDDILRIHSAEFRYTAVQ
jgi:hypothetical protein